MYQKLIDRFLIAIGLKTPPRRLPPLPSHRWREIYQMLDLPNDFHNA